MNAAALKLEPGDKLSLLINSRSHRLKVSGIYSDITNGGRTVKANFSDRSAPIAWQVTYLKLRDPQQVDRYAAALQQKMPQAKISTTRSFVRDTFSQTIAAVRIAAQISVFSSLAVLAAIVVLFLKILLARDRYEIGVLKVSGFTSGDVFKQYLYRLMWVVFLGIVIGTILALTLGEKMVALGMASFGISSFKSVVDYGFTLIVGPAALLLAALLMILLNFASFSKLQTAKIVGGRI